MPPPQMTHREVLEALSGLLLAMFVAMLSSTIVSNALPTIVSDLHGSQTGYTWVVVATLLAMTATTPIWGKLADLFSKKILVQTALVIFSIGSLIAGFALGSQMLFDFIHNNPIFEFHPTAYTNDPALIARNDNMVAINSALQVDLTGQVCSDSIGNQFYSGIGGQVARVGARLSKDGDHLGRDHDVDDH